MIKISVAIIILILGVVAGILHYKTKKVDLPNNPISLETTNSNNQTSQQPQPPASTTKTFTMEEVIALSESDLDRCITVIHDKVYDVTKFASEEHPGGELIFKACGKDGTILFEARPMGSKTPHSTEARKILEQYYIGDLKK